MAGGYMGKNPVCGSSTGEIKEEPLERKMCRDFLGCYGIGGKDFVQPDESRR